MIKALPFPPPASERPEASFDTKSLDQLKDEKAAEPAKPSLLEAKVDVRIERYSPQPEFRPNEYQPGMVQSVSLTFNQPMIPLAAVSEQAADHKGAYQSFELFSCSPLPALIAISVWCDSARYHHSS